ncbi:MULTISPECIES: AAA family ATPase [unclassified Streptomyces]|uniref:AAA family ATPase n=1 Tax=unclassified Streptomyces TaxID=2593676 RepID=UPI0023666729|nr:MULTISPECIES: AAA family ATPase [unclassified Streptomyces]MDF3148800.1 AAA family ATPase [Streptomyces sp. T21Q-yed]WDF37416.1 AAA family ATPase [Streptomyces sp. T12]
MTAPLTPPPPPRDQSSRHAWQQPAAGHAGSGPHDAVHGAPPGAQDPHGSHGTYGIYGSYEQDGPGMKTEVREAAVVAVVVALFGALLGALWWWLAPSVPLVGDVVDKSWVVYFKDTEGEQAVGVDGTFTLLALVFGLVSAVAVFLWRRRGGVPLVVALAVGGFLGSLLAWRVGVWLGPAEDVIGHAKDVGKGVAFSAPLKLGAKGAWLAWPLAALVVHLGLTALFGPRDADPYQQLPEAQQQGLGPYGPPSA